MISGGPYGYEHVNAAEQRRDPNSLLNWTERIIRMRKEVPEIGWGDFEVIDIAHAGGPCDPLRLAQQFGACSCTTSTRNRARSGFRTGVEGERGKRLIDLLSDNHCEADKKGRHHLLLGAYDYRWYRVGGLDYLLNRSDIDLQQQQLRTR